MYRLLPLVFMLVLFAAVVSAERGHTTLLATSDPLDGGVVADLYLEIKPGSGRVFIESSPLTRVDTQISTRFAKEVACNYVERDCSDLDFFYTINARASIIGGPSAGAAMTALTVAELEGVELNDSVAITGTINSGAIIGSVGGIMDKVDAASRSDIKKVLIPKGERTSFARNQSVDMFDFGKERGVEVVEVFSIDEVMIEFTGQSFQREQRQLEIDPRYSNVMESLADGLCERTDRLAIAALRDSINSSQTIGVQQTAANLSGQGEIARQSDNYYAAASFCFGANVRYKYLDLVADNLSDEELLEGLESIEKDAEVFEDVLDRNLTVSDTQILAVVLDRVTETYERVENSRFALNNSDKDGALFEFAFAIERLESARSWSTFFGVMPALPLSEDTIRNACDAKVAEAEERVQYTSILLRRDDNSARTQLTEAQQLRADGDYVQCLHKATLSKAEANVLLSLTGVRPSDVPEIVDRKREAARMSIASQAEQEIFPIVGYSYYEYAGSLRNTDRFSALLFSEYALEFSNLELYFDEEPNTIEIITTKSSPDRNSILMFFLIGFVSGIFIAFISVRLQKKPKKKRIIVRKRAKK